MKRSFLQLPVVLALTLLALFLGFAGESTAHAQGSSGTLTGTVTDATGAVIPGAVITATDPATNTKFAATTNKSGQYTIANVPPANYNISSSKSGFATDLISGQAVTVGTQSNANFKMMVGAENTTIEVQSTAADLQTLNATVGVTVSELSIESLPSVQRDVSTFATLQPGVTPGGSVAGTVTDQASFTLDGGNNSSDMDGSMLNYTGSFAGNPTGMSGTAFSGSSGVMPTPQDSIEEFRIATAGQTADFNNSTGFQAQIVTRRGRNTPHGTAYEYYLDSNIGANSWQNRLTKTVKPSYHFNRFGGALGGEVLPSYLGGKTYLFGMYEGYRYPASATYTRPVPSADLRNGIVTLNITVNGVATPTRFNLKQYDPRGIGLSPVMAQMWNTEEPDGNDPGCTGISGARCDGVNEIAFRANVALPQKSDFGVARIDHDFGDKWHANASFRQYAFTNLTSNQVDIGGVLGGTKGVPKALAPRPQTPWFLVAGVTTNITSRLTNDFHYSYLRNIWYWNSAEAPPQLPTLGGALEPMGEQSIQVLSPYNVSTQQIRERVWDGHDHYFADDLTLIKGNQLIQFGGQYQHNFAYHNRTDNGGGINYTTTYQVGDNAGNTAATLPGLANACTTNPALAGQPCLPATGTTNVRLLSAALGIVNDSQVAYTRSGDNLTLNPGKTRASDSTTIPYYNMYITDAWHVKKSLTLTGGLGYAIEMPPTEATGKQVVLVDSSANPIYTDSYLAQRASAASQGQVYNPMIGFALLGNVNGKPKYPYNPFYGGISPRISVAWNPHAGHDSIFGKMLGDGATVIRGGFGRQFGRLNGVSQVLTPLLGPGLIQAVQCRTALATGVCGTSTPNDTTAFRIGVDGFSAPLPSATATLPQPNFPGYNSAASAAPQVLDPSFRPNDTTNFNVSIQRQVNNRMLVEVGYIGRLIRHENNSVLLNTVPYMMSQGGQTFAAAYAAVEQAFGCTVSAGLCSSTTTKATTGTTKVYPTVSAQPFFETALAGTGYCTGYANCTTAVVQKQASFFGNQNVWSLWSALDNGGFNFARTMQNTPIAGQANGGQGQLTSGVATSIANGYGNYNGGFISFKVNNFHGFTLQSNVTYSKALGINAEPQATSSYTVNDAFDLSKNYGVQYFQQKFITNTFVVYQTPWFKNQRGIVGRLLGGYTIAPIFAAGTGLPVTCGTFGTQSFGGDDNNGFSDSENCVFLNPHVSGVEAHRVVTGGTDAFGISVGTQTAGSGAAAINRFTSPQAVYDSVRPPILGIDTRSGGDGVITGLPYWNMDVSIRKNLKVYERVNMEFSGIITNVFNHLDFGNGGLSLATPASFGVITSQANSPRQIQMGVRASF